MDTSGCLEQYETRQGHSIPYIEKDDIHAKQDQSSNPNFPTTTSPSSLQIHSPVTCNPVIVDPKNIVLAVIKRISLNTPANVNTNPPAAPMRKTAAMLRQKALRALANMMAKPIRGKA